MASRLRLAAFLLLALATAPLQAQEGAVAGPEPSGDFFYRLDSAGNPVFSQLLRWENDPGVLEFQVIIRDSSGAAVIDERVSEAQREVQLEPGSYTYKIIAYNLLGKIETETEWIPIEVIKAEQPVIRSSSPRTIYMDTFDERVTIVGENLLENLSICLIDATGKKYVGTVKVRDGQKEATVVFPAEAYSPGTYTLYAENPGGLSAVAENALSIRFQRPVDILFSVGYAPLIALYDDWFVEEWSSAFHPLGFSAQLGLFFLKRSWGSLGIELEADFRRMSGGSDEAAFTSDFILAGANVMYKTRFSQRLHGVARAGGGIARSYHNFDYEGFSGPDTISYDPFARAGLALQAFLPGKLYGEIGADFSWLFLLNHSALGLTPKLCVGYQIF
jgi:hypothetical protein